MYLEMIHGSSIGTLAMSSTRYIPLPRDEAHGFTIHVPLFLANSA